MHAARTTKDLRLGSGYSVGLLAASRIQQLCSVVHTSWRAYRPRCVHRLLRSSRVQYADPAAAAAGNAAASSDGWRKAAGQPQTSGSPQVPPASCTSRQQLPGGNNEHAAAMTTWQQRQQQQGKSQQRRQQWQQRRQAAAIRPKPRQGFADYSSYQCLLAAVQQMQQPQAGQCSAQGQQAVQQQQQQQKHWQPKLNASDFVNLIEQLAVISRAASACASSAIGSSNSFVEDQALLQILPLAYDILDHYAHIQPSLEVPMSPGTATAQQLTGRQHHSTATAALQPTDLLRCISNLAALKYNQPSRLAALLELKAAGRLGLSRLRMHQLSALVAGLAKAGVKPSNVWLVTLMQEAERRLPAAKLRHLAQLLHGLVRMGVKPAASWLDSLQDQAVQCLIEQAVQCQVSMSHIQQQQARQDLNILVPAAAATLDSSGAVWPGRQEADGQLHDIAQLLIAFAEAKHGVKLQLSAALWGATADSLAAANVAALVEVLSAVGELKLVPPSSWMQQYYSSTAVHLLQDGQYKPWQLAASIEACGRLVKAGMLCTGSRSSREKQGLQDGQRKDLSSAFAWSEAADASVIACQQEVQSSSNGITCSEWVAAVLSAAQQQLSSFAARDIAALLSGLAALQLPLEPQQLQPLLAEVQQKLPRLNTAGITLLAKAAAQLEQQMKQQHQQQEQPAVYPEQKQPPVLLTQGWMFLLLQEAAAKLPMFPAQDLAELLIVLAGSGVAKPSSLWLEAAAVQLQNKLVVLEPEVLVQVLAALTAMAHQPNQQWLSSALAVLESRVIDLQLADLAQLLAVTVKWQHRADRPFIAAARWALQQQQMMASQCRQQRLVTTSAVSAMVDAGDTSRGRTQESDGLVIVCERLLKQLEW